MPPFVRPFQASDTEAAKAICRATLPPSLSSSQGAYLASPYLWTLQYTHLFPQNCFVLDDGAGTAVGYVIGCPDVFALAATYPRFVREVLESEQGRADVPVPPQLDVLEPWSLPAANGSENGGESGSGGSRVNVTAMAQMAYNPRWLVLEGVEGKAELVATYRATMHIDLLPGFQGQGWGRKLIERFCEGIRQAGTDGFDYGKGINIGVAGENTKVVPFYERLQFRVYEGGEKEGNVWMVKDL